MDFKTLFAQLVVFFGKLTQTQKTIIGTAVAGIIAFLVFLVVYTSEGSKKDNDGYQVLFEQLSAEDSAKVIEQLEKEQMAKLSASKDIPDFGPGDTVLVGERWF